MHLPWLLGREWLPATVTPRERPGAATGTSPLSRGEAPSQGSWDGQWEVINKVNKVFTSAVGRAGSGLSTALFWAPGILQTPWEQLHVLGELRVEGATTRKSSSAWAALGKGAGVKGGSWCCSKVFQSSYCRQCLKMTKKVDTGGTHLQHTPAGAPGGDKRSRSACGDTDSGDRPKNGIILIILQEFGEEP